MVDSPLPDGSDWWMEALAMFLLVPGLVGLVWLLNPSLVFQLEAQGTELLSVADGGEVDQLEISSEDVSFMNRVYRERTHEIGYCGLVTGDVLRPWLGDTINATSTQVVFTTSNCPFEPDALIHTHPSGDLSLSETDKETFRDSGLEFSCIHAGPIPEEPGSSAVNLACYEIDGEGFSEVDVSVVEG